MREAALRRSHLDAARWLGLDLEARFERGYAMGPVVGLSDGRQARYEVIGQGRPTLMLPGGPGFGAEYMRGDAELFADTLQSCLIDPHGSGRSTPPSDPTAYSPEGHAAFYEEVRRALDLHEVLLVGHSFGATTALTYSALFPDVVVGCVAVAAFGIGPDTGTAEADTAEADYERALARHATADWYPEARIIMDEWTERVLATDDPREVERMMQIALPLYTAHPDRPEVADGLTAMSQRLTVDLPAAKAWEGGLYQTIDLRPVLSKITTPTLIVAGELDFLCGPGQARPICEATAGARLEIIPDCGHLPTVEAPQAYRQAVKRFLSP
jgi:proline iminopeptidase